MTALNTDQKKAASHGRGHAVVLAGPGTGKTSTLKARHAFLVSRNVPPECVFVVTFTQKAAEELRIRLSGQSGSNAWIGTFHSHCLRLLRRFSEEAGLAKNFKVLDPAGQQRVLRELGVEWNQDDGDLTDMFSSWKDNLLTPDEVMAEANRKGGITEKLAAEHFAAYEEKLAKDGSLDFSDLLSKALTLLKTSETVKSFVSSRLPFALVDEFQDANRVQVELLQSMASAGSSIWAVGDDDQALYGWRGSNVDYTVRFSDYFHGAARYTLRTNYRCDPAILTAATVLIGHNRQRVPKELSAAKSHKPGNVVRINAFRDEKEEAAWLATSISNFLQKGAKPKDIGILVRTSSLTPHIQQSLEAARIPMSLTGTVNFWESAEVTAFADLLDAIENGDERTGFRYKGGADFVKTMQGHPPTHAAKAVGEFLGSRPPANANAERIASWADGIETVASIASGFRRASDFRNHVTTMSATTTSQSSEGVSVTTIHSSKGLEYRHVFVAGVEAAVLPHRKSKDPEEERRLFYVALTRSKGAVDVTFSKSRAGRKQQPSPFLTEINGAGPEVVRWSRREDEPESKENGKAETEKPSARVVERPKGLPTVYRRKDGSRTMVPPED